MSENVIQIDAPPEAVYDVLTDAEAYRKWVVGAKNIRGADRNWPQPGSRFHHTVGGGPLTIDDTSKVIEAVPNRRWVLEARFRPFGIARVAMDLEPLDSSRRTRVVMREVPVGGPLRKVPALLLDPAIHLRNAISLRRLRRLVTSRVRQR